MKTIMKTMAGALSLGLVLSVVGGAKPAEARNGGAGWQSAYQYTVPTGLPSLFFHLPCPTGFSASNGGFQVSSVTQGNGFLLSGNGPRLDINPPNFGEWGWNFRWDAGGAPAGSIIVFDVLCKKGTP